MRKLTRLDVEALKKEMPVLDEAFQRSIYGGCGSYNGGYVYSMEQYESMLASGSWTGGTVEGVGYISAEVTVRPYYDSDLRKTGVESYDSQYKAGFELGFQLGLKGGYANWMAAMGSSLLSGASAGSDFGDVNYDMTHYSDGVRDGFYNARNKYGYGSGQ
ncbi:MAG: hypothetical protein LBT43_14240 [Prevotella sp.]|jgi:hypothetical protein|nr:hypothetical protein [Prevotella sp.]